eukprot:TRINITY_DN1200_c0_g1_i1.p1 TRINITY_DN1200_c0_g1~~TRINITY_DN1200_c0_g1_i1.p1  ORF type:complete len:239 (-),score=44.07 TRINITY_DN1200_c0_g1_i1:63-779(-)
MRNRYDCHEKSLKLFLEIIDIDPDMFEARLKISWISLKRGEYELCREVLKYVVESPNANLSQKRRAYTNLSCSHNWDDEDFDNETFAEEYARKGLEIARTSKLLENLGSSLRKQHRIDEAIEIYQELVEMDPNSSARKRLTSLQKKKSFSLNLAPYMKKSGSFSVTSPCRKKPKNNNTAEPMSASVPSSMARSLSNFGTDSAIGRSRGSLFIKKSIKRSVICPSPPPTKFTANDFQFS